ncbi:MAG TPA: dihydroorotase, partial [Acidimicrobiaceae bacterium]|nr:dihydroorotase [Acidimicrobiaceae bacterium]HCB36838.1 dihydroorotase [Acidimicrobiaceae bacterium]
MTGGDPAGDTVGDTPGEIVLVGGEVVDAGGRRRADVLITGATIREVGPGAAGAGAARPDAGRPHGRVVLDAAGCFVVPGFVDLFARLGEPGREQVETVRCATAAAALGGYTAVLAQPDTDPPVDCAAALAEQHRLSAGADCTVVATATLSAGRAGTRLAPFGELTAAGVRWFTDIGPPADHRLLLRALEYLRPLGATVAVTPFTPALAAGTAMSEGAVSGRLGLRAEPAVSEEIAVDTAIALAREADCRLHLDRISTAVAVDRLRRAKADGVPVSASVSAQHLYFTDEHCAGFDPLLRAVPPYRRAADREALRAGVEDGTVDAVVSGHTPQPTEDTEQPFELAPPGALALQTAAAVALGSCGLTPAAAVRALSRGPAELAGIADRFGRAVEPGAPANLTVFDPTAQWEPAVADLVSRSRNSPYLGLTLTGRVRHTIHEGRVAVCGG